MAKDPRLLLGQRVRVLRLAQGISQEELADRAGVHRTYLGGVERGERNPSLRNIARIAGALGVEPGDLFLNETRRRTLGQVAEARGPAKSLGLRGLPRRTKSRRRPG
jgi:transcriptional regulator with XRE-family HTH domain